MNNRPGNGSTIAQKGFCIPPKDGKTRGMGDLFPADHLHSRYADSVKLTEEQMQAANLQGIGRLREAA